MTDYTPGDPPVPIGTVVLYSHVEGTTPTEYEITDHYNPKDHPRLPPGDYELKDIYPDGVAYLLWPVGVEKAFRNRDRSVGWVRRTSFRIAKENEA